MARNTGQGSRAAKVADRIKLIVATVLERGIKDPRMGFVTITEVRVTGDLQHASIFYTVLGDDQERADTAAALASATGMVRSEIGKNLKIRLTPSIEFIHDALPETASHLEDLLAKTRVQDRELQKAAEKARYAGDSDPYRHPEPDESDSEA